MTCTNYFYISSFKKSDKTMSMCMITGYLLSDTRLPPSATESVSKGVKHMWHFSLNIRIFKNSTFRWQYYHQSLHQTRTLCSDLGRLFQWRHPWSGDPCPEPMTAVVCHVVLCSLLRLWPSLALTSHTWSAWHIHTWTETESRQKQRAPWIFDEA